jgi:hypothetical protein
VASSSATEQQAETTTSTSSRFLPSVRAMPASSSGRIRSVTYCGEHSSWLIQPSAIAPASRVIAGPIAAR